MGAISVLTFETHLTAVAATSTGDYTVVFVGTNKGHLKKVSAVKLISRIISGILSIGLALVSYLERYGRKKSRRDRDAENSRDAIKSRRGERRSAKRIDLGISDTLGRETLACFAKSPRH